MFVDLYSSCHSWHVHIIHSYVCEDISCREHPSMKVCTRTCIYVHITDTHANIHTYTHTYTQLFTCICKPVIILATLKAHGIATNIPCKQPGLPSKRCLMCVCVYIYIYIYIHIYTRAGYTYDCTHARLWEDSICVRVCVCVCVRALAPACMYAFGSLSFTCWQSWNFICIAYMNAHRTKELHKCVAYLVCACAVFPYVILRLHKSACVFTCMHACSGAKSYIPKMLRPCAGRCNRLSLSWQHDQQHATALVQLRHGLLDSDYWGNRTCICMDWMNVRLKVCRMYVRNHFVVGGICSKQKQGTGRWRIAAVRACPASRSRSHGHRWFVLNARLPKFLRLHSMCVTSRSRSRIMY